MTASGQYITTHIAANILQLGERRVRAMCDLGVFATAHKPGFGAHAHWLILRAEVSAHKFNGHKRSKKQKETNGSRK